MDENDGRFPDESYVWVLYPLDEATGRVDDRMDHDRWVWLPGEIVERRGPDEWAVFVLDKRCLMLADGRKPRRNTPGHKLYYPTVRRTSIDLRPARAADVVAARS